MVKLVKFTSSFNDNKLPPIGGSQGINRLPKIGARAAVAGWGKYIHTIGGWRSDGYGSCEHPAGQGIDIMTNAGCSGNWRAKTKETDAFWDMARYFRKYDNYFGVYYIIWRQKIWSNQRDGDNWRNYTGGSGCNHGHWNHIHIAFCSANNGSCKPCSQMSYGSSKYSKAARPIPPPLANKKKLPSGVISLSDETPTSSPGSSGDLIVSYTRFGTARTHSAFEVPLGAEIMYDDTGINPEDDGEE